MLVYNWLLINNNIRFKSYGIGFGGWIEHVSNCSYNWIGSNEDDTDSNFVVDVCFGSNK